MSRLGNSWYKKISEFSEVSSQLIYKCQRKPTRWGNVRSVDMWFREEKKGKDEWEVCELCCGRLHEMAKTQGGNCSQTTLTDRTATGIILRGLDLN